MKKVITYIASIGLLLFMGTSCTDVLDQQSVSSFNEQVVFSDVNVVKSYLGKCYDRLGGNTNNGILGMREDLLASGTDQTLCIHRPTNYGWLKGTLSPDFMGWISNGSFGGFMYWDPIYLNIQNINTILASIDGVPTTTQEALKTQLKGEAYFLRAFEYAQLLMNYGGAVITTQPYKLGQDFLTITRSTISQTLDQVISDADQAIALLPASMEQGRANRAAAQALKARVLMFCASPLTNGGYEASNTLVSFPSGSQTTLLTSARDAAKAIMDGTYGAFALAGTTADPPATLTEDDVKAYSENFFSIFNQKGKWNSETIWGIQYTLQGTNLNLNRANIWFGPNGYHNWGNNNPTEPAIRKFEMADGTPFVWDNGLGVNLRQATAAQLAADPTLNPYAGREPRFYATVLFHGAPWQARPSDAAKFDPDNKVQSGHFYLGSLAAPGAVSANGIDTRQGLIESWNGTKNGYYLKKFMDPATAGQYYYNTNTWNEFRYAEVLLIYAEACIELGGANLQLGLDALNMVRNRAGLPDRVTADVATARDYLRQERFVEFFAEGHRWYDIRRWMIATSGIIEDVYEMKVKQFANGDYEWKIDLAARADQRAWTTANNNFYWLPITRSEMNKAPQLQQNPGYN